MITSRFLKSPLTHYASKAIIPDAMTGEISEDQSAIIGKNNWCYIYKGTNNYYDSYIDDSFRSLGEIWASIIEARQQACDRLGVQFLQIIVPNKLTLIPDYFPKKINQETSFALEGILSAAPNANLLAPLTEFRDTSIRETIFRRNDSHLSIAGNVYLLELILSNLGLNNFNAPLIEVEPTTHIGDLGSKFNNMISEELFAPLWSKGLLSQECIIKTKDISSGGLTGIEQSFINPYAPINKKIVIFGNSFFERVPSWGLSPFFSALFREFSFYWLPEINIDIIKKQGADIIISQTCERFLNKTPSSVN